MPVPFQWIDQRKDLQEAVDRGLKEKIISLDTEFIRERTFYPKLCLIQLALAEQIYLIDAIALKDELGLLLPLLTDPRILKIIHASRLDQECFYFSLGCVASPVFDTSLAVCLLGFPENMGLAKLVREFLEKDLKKGLSRVYWDKRPLSSESLEYAASDVLFLIPLYEILSKRLKRVKRLDWAIEISSIDPKEFEESEIQVAKRLLFGNPGIPRRHWNAFLALVEWREKKIREANIPRNWFLSNEALIALVKTLPKSKEQLMQFRSLSKSWVEKYHEKVLEMLHRKYSKKCPIEIENSSPGPSLDTAVIQLFKCYLEYLSRQLGIHPNFLIPPRKLNGFLIQHFSSKKKTSELPPGIHLSAYQLILENIEPFLKGKLALRLYRGGVQVKKL